jgi:hypothetical protein
MIVSWHCPFLCMESHACSLRLCWLLSLHLVGWWRNQLLPSAALCLSPARTSRQRSAAACMHPMGGMCPSWLFCWAAVLDKPVAPGDLHSKAKHGTAWQPLLDGACACPVRCCAALTVGVPAAW